MTNVVACSVARSVFNANTAVRGGGLSMQQRSVASLRHVMVAGCTAQVGGGVSVSSDSAMHAADMVFDSNVATQHGGGLSVDGRLSAGDNAVVCSGCAFVSNVATGNGGGLHCLASHVNATASEWLSNTGTYGGGASFDAGCTVDTASTVWVHNTATLGGGAMCFDGIPTGIGGGSNVVRRGANATAAGVVWSHVAAVNNTAVAGTSVLWRLPLPHDGSAAALPTAPGACVLCRFDIGGVATTGVAIVPWTSSTAAPTVVSVASGMRIGDFVTDPAAVPALSVVGLLASPDLLDNATVCELSIADSSDATAVVSPSTVRVSQGVVSFADVVVQASAATTLTVSSRCTIESPVSGVHTSHVAVSVTIAPCRGAWELSSDRVCKRCLQGFYSHSGQLCKVCPASGDCKTTVGSGDDRVSSGVAWPAEKPGYWLGHARASVLSGQGCAAIWAARLHPDTGHAVCAIGLQPNVRNDGRVTCVGVPNVKPDDLFACATGLELYECPAKAMCEGGSTMPHTSPGAITVPDRRLAEAETFTASNSTCRVGHTGVLCSLCEPGYIPNNQQLCEECPGSQMRLYGVATLLLIVVIALGFRVRSGGGSARDGRGDGTRRCCGRKIGGGTSMILSPRGRSQSAPMSAYVNAFVQGTMKQPYKVCRPWSAAYVWHTMLGSSCVWLLDR